MTLFYTDEMWLESKEFPLHISLYLFEKGETVPSHAHQFIEFVYVAEGKGRHEYRGQSYEISKGDVFIIEPHIPHSYQAYDTPLHVYNVLFQPSVLDSELSVLSREASFLDFFYIEPFFRHYADFQTRLSLMLQEHLEAMLHLDLLLREYTNKEMGYRIVIKNRLIELFVYLSRRYANRSQRQWPPLQDENRLFQDMTQFISRHYASPLSLEQMSELCGMSVSTFSVKFKAYFGQTFVEYRNGIRIQVAQDLLLRTDTKILSISEQVGFEDLSFFNKLFRRVTGETPKSFREGRRG